MPNSSNVKNKNFLTLSVAALGVVFGDIGTSPLYTMRECLRHPGITNSSDHVFGVLSLISWALILMISLKYLVYVMHADNNGEGGVLALTALGFPERRH